MVVKLSSKRNVHFRTPCVDEEMFRIVASGHKEELEDLQQQMSISTCTLNRLAESCFHFFFKTQGASSFFQKETLNDLWTLSCHDRHSDIRMYAVVHCFSSSAGYCYDGYTPWTPPHEAATGRLRQIDAQKIQQLEELQMLGCKQQMAMHCVW